MDKILHDKPENRENKYDMYRAKWNKEYGLWGTQISNGSSEGPVGPKAALTQI